MSSKKFSKIFRVLFCLKTGLVQNILRFYERCLELTFERSVYVRTNSIDTTYQAYATFAHCSEDFSQVYLKSVMQLFAKIVNSPSFMSDRTTKTLTFFTMTLHCVKCVRIWSYSGPHFSAFGLNTERYLSSPNAGKYGSEQL